MTHSSGEQFQPNLRLHREWMADTSAEELDPAAPTRSTVSRWPKELKQKRKMELHCKRMTRFRNKKAAEHKGIVKQHRSLEKELELRLVELRRTGVHQGSEACSELLRELQRLVLEREVLRQESVALREDIARYQKFHTAIHTASGKLPPAIGDDRASSCDGTSVRYVDSQWQMVPVQGDRRVDFPGGEMPFFFHPFSREEFDAALFRQTAKLCGDTSTLRFAGNFLAWDVYHAPLLKSAASGFLIGWARYSRRLHCSLDAVRAAMIRDDGTHEWPILATSKNLGFTDNPSVQTLQEFDEDAGVIIRSQPGDGNYRYLGLVERAKWCQVHDKRVLKYSFVTADSIANARSRDAEPTLANNTRWVNEGGSFLTLADVEDGVVNVVFDLYACAESAQRAQTHFILFGNLVSRWEQLVAPSKLLML